MSEMKIAEFAKVRRGASPRPISDPKYFGGSVGWVRIVDVTASTKFLKKTEQYVSALGESLSVRVDRGDLIMSICGTIGRPIIVDMPACIHDGFVHFYDIKNVDSEFLYYTLQFHEQGFQNKGQPGTQVNINTSIVGDFSVYIPSLTAQQKIAKILSTIDGQIEKTEAIIAKYQAVKQGMLQDLFTRGIDVATGELRPKYEDAPGLYKDSPLGMIPKEWEVKRLEQICQMKSGDGITSESITDVGEYHVYGGNGLRGYTNKYTHEGYYVLIGRQGALCGNITKARDKFYASEHAVVVTLFEKMDTDWLAEKLEMMTLNKYSEASAQPGLSVSKILRLNITKPAYDEQKIISAKFLQVSNKLLIEGKQLCKLKFIKQGLMSDLLSGKVEVSA